MADKQIKIWLSVFIFTLMAVGSAASYFAQGKVFYKGTVNSEQLYTSVLNAETESSEQAPELNFKAPENFVIPAEAGISGEDNIPPKAQPVSSPCSSGEKPIIKNGQVSGCTSEQKEPVSLRADMSLRENPPPADFRSNLAPPPKVKILTEPTVSYNLQPTTYNLTSCESQNLFTYTGPDRPGLLYGMCIECGTNQYIIHGGKCHPEPVEG